MLEIVPLSMSYSWADWAAAPRRVSTDPGVEPEEVNGSRAVVSLGDIMMAVQWGRNNNDCQGQNRRQSVQKRGRSGPFFRHNAKSMPTDKQKCPLVPFSRVKTRVH